MFFVGQWAFKSAGHGGNFAFLTAIQLKGIILGSKGQDMKSSVVIIFLILMTTSLYAQTKVAMVKILRGEVDVMTIGKTTKLQKEDWVEAGSVVKTGDKSFVRLVFIDKSTMNISANSEMKIETFSGKDAGVIDLVKGKIRSQVTKDYLQIKDKDKSKMFIKTQNAVMGVRGTDFMITTNGTTTAAVLFEGEIAFNKLDQRGSLSTDSLEQIVDRGVRIYPQDFSVVDPSRSMPTVPARLNVQQFEKLEKNNDMVEDKTTQQSQARSIVPAGLSGQQVSNTSNSIKSEVQVSQNNTPSSADPEGYVKGNLVKPANGSFIHIETGTIIPPEPTAVLDPNTNTYISGSPLGDVANDGSFVPKENININEKGVFVTEVSKIDPERKPNSDGKGPEKKPEVKPEGKPIPITPFEPAPAPDSPRDPAGGPFPTGPLPMPLQPPLPSEPPPQYGTPICGGICGVNDPTRQSTLIDTTIIVNPN